LAQAEEDEKQRLMSVLSYDLLMGSEKQIKEQAKNYYENILKEQKEQTLASLFRRIKDCKDEEERKVLMEEYYKYKKN